MLNDKIAQATSMIVIMGLVRLRVTPARIRLRLHPWAVYIHIKGHSSFGVVVQEYTAELQTPRAL